MVMSIFVLNSLPFYFMPIVIEVIHLVGYKQTYAIKNNDQPSPPFYFCLSYLFWFPVVFWFHITNNISFKLLRKDLFLKVFTNSIIRILELILLHNLAQLRYYHVMKTKPRTFLILLALLFSLPTKKKSSIKFSCKSY